MPAYPADIPSEPEPPGIGSKEFIRWLILPNGMIRFEFDLDGDKKMDYYTDRRLKPEGQGMARTQEDAIAEIPNWPKSLFLYYFDSGIHAWRWLAIEKHPLFYKHGNNLYIDPEEDGINGNEAVYENLFQTERKT